MTDYVAFSGGIDSTALALLMPELIPIFTDTGWEFPHVYKHIARFEGKTDREVIKLANSNDNGIPERIKRLKFMPNHGARWCTREFKILPIERLLQDGDTLAIALRADEPNRVGNWAAYARYPLREMGKTRIDCIEICLEHDLLPRNPPYAARGGCVGCFYKRKSEIIAMQALIPEILDELRELEESVQDERGSFFHMFPNIGMSIRELQQQPPLFNFADMYQQAADVSDYGQACGLFCNR